MSGFRRPRDPRRLFALGFGIAAVYVAAAALGFKLAFVAEQVTTVWAPTGIAQAVLLLWGRSLWPAVWIGAFAANASTEAPLWTALFIATGNTLEAVVAAWGLSRVAGFDSSLRRTRDGLAFLAIAAGLSTTLSATIGVAALCAANVQPWAQFQELWAAWWVGDALGSLVVAPVILTIARGSSPETRGQRIEGLVLILTTVVVTQAVYGQVGRGADLGHPLEYILVPFVIAAAVRLGQPGTALVVLAASAVAVSNTVQGLGPFAGADVNRSLLRLQVFTGVLAGTGLLLAAAIAERKTGERRRSAAYGAGQVLADAADLEHAAPDLLKVICTTLQWPVGAIWLVDNDAQRLRCLAVWRNPATPTTAFAQATLEMRFPVGVGLPGRVWANGKATWIEDVADDANFPRLPIARAAGLHGAFAFPIWIGHELVGAMEFFNPSVLTPDPDLLGTMSTVGTQIGQFIARKRVEAVIIDEQRRTHAILETALDAIIGMDHQGRIIEFNPAAERTFGYSRDQAVGRELADLLIPTELRDSHRAGLRRYLATGEGPFIDRRIETMAIHADGHQVPVEVSITRVQDLPPRFTGFVRDLTARAQAEREREMLLQRELTARREAEAANRAKDEFLATLSHELRTPLNAIVGWTRMLLGGMVDEQSARTALEVIDRNAQLQTQLVEDILDVSRIITGGLRVDSKPVDFGYVIEAALDAVRPAADAKKIHIRSNLSAAARVTEGDPKRLQQIVWNLLSNAVKFTSAGGRIEVELTEADANNVRLRVQDDGAGIDPGFLPHVFERFRQADGSVSRHHGGLGLGLAIVRHLVELHGGTVRAESDGLGKGATFTVELPRVTTDRFAAAGHPHSVAAETAQIKDVRPLLGRRALVVDDDADARHLIQTILTTAGASVQTASTAREALDLLERSQPDVLLADVGMPGEDGFALIRAVRARETRTGRRLPAAAVTAYAGNQDRERVLTAGFDSHLAKPIVPAPFVRAVVSLCGEPRSTP